ncbi:MAG: hypothetical protein QXP71_02075 [Desulfurococcaceae archaeon]
MYDLFLRILRDEINSSSLIDISRIKINEYRNYLVNAFREISTENTEVQKYFNEIIKNIMRDADLLVRMRLVKNILNSIKPVDSVDTDLYSIVEKLIYFYKVFLTNFYIGVDDNIYVVFRRKCSVDNRVFMKNDIVKLDPLTCIKLYLNDCVDLIVKPYIVETIESS